MREKQLHFNKQLKAVILVMVLSRPQLPPVFSDEKHPQFLAATAALEVQMLVCVSVCVSVTLATTVLDF